MLPYKDIWTIKSYAGFESKWCSKELFFFVKLSAKTVEDTCNNIFFCEASQLTQASEQTLCGYLAAKMI